MLFGVPPDTREHSPRTSSHASARNGAQAECRSVAADGVKFLTSSDDRIRVRLLPLLHDDRGAVGGIR